MNKDEIKEKILRYETHLNETLRNDLKTCLGDVKGIVLEFYIRVVLKPIRNTISIVLTTNNI